MKLIPQKPKKLAKVPVLSGTITAKNNSKPEETK